MSVQRADLMGTRHTLNITYPTPQETLAGSPTLLPTSEPASATFSYTVAAGDLPTFDGVPTNTYYLALVYAGGKNTDASNNRTLCYRIKKNGTSIYTSTSLTVTANLNWTLSIYGANLNPVTVGDVFEVYLWQVTTNALNWDYNAFCVDVSRIQVDSIGKLIANAVYTYTQRPSLTLGSTPTPYTTQGVTVYIQGGSGTDGYKKDLSGFTFAGIRQHSTYNMYRSSSDGIYPWSEEIQSHASLKPRYYANRAISKIEWTPTNIIL